ncbi:hypothetical protein K438DRAFT_1163371 [Mycena galopus ATCC 62051]|nr:hypothetical protein K438DRAFT_1163371 [Mycena galopus ATCC 62051]
MRAKRGWTLRCVSSPSLAFLPFSPFSFYGWGLALTRAMRSRTLAGLQHPPTDARMGRVDSHALALMPRDMGGYYHGGNGIVGRVRHQVVWNQIAYTGAPHLHGAYLDAPLSRGAMDGTGNADEGRGGCGGACLCLICLPFFPSGHFHFTTGT